MCPLLRGRARADRYGRVLADGPSLGAWPSQNGPAVMDSMTSARLTQSDRRPFGQVGSKGQHQVYHHLCYWTELEIHGKQN